MPYLLEPQIHLNLPVSYHTIPLLGILSAGKQISGVQVRYETENHATLQRKF